MSILEAMKSATLRLSLDVPETYFGNPDTIALEMCDLSNEVLEDVLLYQDWQALQKVGTIIADGSQAEFDRPADYKRMLVNSDMQDARTWAWGYGHITDLNTFMLLRRQNIVPNPGVWIMYGDKFHFTPPPSGEAQFAYMSDLAVRDMETLETKSRFTKDTDEFILNDHLITLGLIWRWRMIKKMPIDGEEEDFKAALATYGSKDAGSNIMRSGANMYANRFWTRRGLYR